jgi:long-chain fatty acid transport protein
MTKKGVVTFVLICSLLIPFSETAFAVGSAGIENASFSAESLAQGDAVTAQANEPAAISYNPAGITQLDGLQVQPNIHFLSILTSFKSRTPDTVPGEKSSATIVPVPTGYITLNPGDLLGDRLSFGIGSDSPFGLSNKYDSDHPTVRYAGWNNWFKMYTIKPVVAVKLFEWLSIGGGPMWYRVFDWGGIQAYPNRLILGAGAPDGQVRLNLSGHGWGWHMGLLAKPHKKHQFGFYFRSPVVVHTSGLAKVERGLTAALATTANFETGAFAKYNLPLNFTWAYAFKPTDRSTIEFDFGYTRWSTFERLFIDHDAVGSATLSAFNDTIINAIGRADKDFRDSFSFQLGGNHKLTDKLTVRLGSWYYTAATPNSSFIPAIPGGNRLGYATGFGYKVTEHIIFDTSYYQVWTLRRKINNDVASALGVSEDGAYTTFAQALTLSLTYKWDNIFKDLGLDRSSTEEVALSSVQSSPAVTA